MSFQLISLKIFKKQLIYYPLLVLAILSISLVVFSPYIPNNIRWQPGDKADFTIVSPRYIQFQSSKDREKTDDLRQKRGSVVDPVYVVDEDINKNIKANIITFFTELKQYKAKLTVNPKTEIPEQIVFLEPASLALLIKNLNLNSMEYFTLQNMDDLLDEGIKDVDKDMIKYNLLENLKILELGKKQEDVIAEIVLHFIEPNQVTNKIKMQEQIDSETKYIQPFTTTLKEGQPVIYKGEVVTQDHIEVLKKLNLYGVKINFLKFGGVVILMAFLFLLVERYIYYFHADKFARAKYYVFIYSIIFIVTVMARLMMEAIKLQKIGEMQFLIPISISAMIISIFLTSNIAVLVGTVLSLMIAVMYKSDFYLFLFLFFSVCVSAFSNFEKHRRSELITSGYVVGVFNVLIIIAIGFYKEVGDPLWFAVNGAFGLINGVLSAMISLAIFPYLEVLFKIITSQSLLEQTNLNHPLLKRLMLSAPGTYQHSLMVANLAEAAAEAIHADPILAKTGAYFHDIGKIKRPIFYIENQFGMENPHKTLSPRMSKLIIQSHIKEGVELADKYKIPQSIKDFIEQHHGTSLVSFFYSQAVQSQEKNDADVIKDEFRYAGPKPMSKETVIVMFADALEAAMRTMEKPTPAKIENLIAKILKEKIDDKQLDNCPLTLQEIETIRKTFLEIFRGIYHSRLDYEDEIEQIIEQTNKADT